MMLFECRVVLSAARLDDRGDVFEYRAYGNKLPRVRETFELNQLKSAPSQLLPVFPGFDRLQTCYHSFGPTNILFFFFQVPANFFFIVMTTGQELGH
jgi:hypothetical protein